jgi:hypothetical protein
LRRRPRPKLGCGAKERRRSVSSQYELRQAGTSNMIYEQVDLIFMFKLSPDFKYHHSIPKGAT